MWFLNKEEDVARYFEEQLERCQVEYFDFYLCHAMNEERFQQLQEYRVLKSWRSIKAGKNPSYRFFLPRFPEVLEKICSAYPWEFAQIQLNYMDWDFQDAKTQYEIFRAARPPDDYHGAGGGGALADLGDGPNQVLKRPTKSQRRLLGNPLCGVSA